MTTALFVVSEEGYWGEECIEPLATLDEAGVDVTVATPTGNPPVVDERSVDPETVGEEISEKVLDYDQNDERLANPEPIATVDASRLRHGRLPRRPRHRVGHQHRPPRPHSYWPMRSPATTASHSSSVTQSGFSALPTTTAANIWSTVAT
jgi:hypothetical protein